MSGFFNLSSELLACQPKMSFGSTRPLLTLSTPLPRTPTMRPLLTAMSRASPLECSMEAVCTQRSTPSSEMPSSRIWSTLTGHSSPGPNGVRLPQRLAMRSVMFPHPDIRSLLQAGSYIISTQFDCGKCLHLAPIHGLYLAVMRALSTFPCSAEVIDNLLPRQIIVFASYPLKAEQVCGMVGC